MCIIKIYATQTQIPKFKQSFIYLNIDLGAWLRIAIIVLNRRTCNQGMDIMELKIVIIDYQGMGTIHIWVHKIKDLFSLLYNKLLVGWFLHVLKFRVVVFSYLLINKLVGLELWEV